MAMKFMGKNLRKKVVVPIKNSTIHPRIKEVVTANQPKEEEQEKIEVVFETPKKDVEKKNKKTKKSDNMNANSLNTIETLASAEPVKKVKVEKKEKGLYERTENTVLLTEDNKMLLND